jgi:hypothetical protein
MGPRLDPDPAQLGDGRHDGPVERRTALGPGVDGGPGSWVGVEHLVRGQQVPEVLVAEGHRRDGVLGHCGPRVDVRRALRLQLRRIPMV